MSDKQGQKLSVDSALTLIEYMSYDDKQLLIKKLTNQYDLYCIGYNSRKELKSYLVNNVSEAYRLFIQERKDSIVDVYQSVLCKGLSYHHLNIIYADDDEDEDRDSCSFLKGKFIICNFCKNTMCFICNEVVLSEDHLRTHSMEELSDEILSKYMKTRYYVSPPLKLTL